MKTYAEIREQAEAEGLYVIPEQNLPAVRQIEARFARRAVKLGVPSFVVREVREEFEERKHDHPKLPTIHRHVIIALDGPAPKLAGWTLAAAIDPLPGEDENLIQTVPGIEVTIPTEFRRGAIRCDHCKAVRRRTRTYILRNDDGRWAQVGRNCLADFLGAPVEGIIALQQFIASIRMREEWAEDGGSRGTSYLDPMTLLTMTIRVMKSDGWLSRTKAREAQAGTPTIDVVLSLMFPGSSQAAQARVVEWERENPLTEGQTAEAEAAIVWAQGLPTGEEAKSDYLHNLASIARCECIPEKHAALFASLIPTYRREMGKEIERKARAEKMADSQYVGLPKQRLDFGRVTVVFMREFESAFGTSTLVKMMNEHGDVIVWWASNLKQEVEQGHVYTMKATVKAHGEHEGVKQTTVQRAALTPVVEPMPPDESPVEEALRQEWPVGTRVTTPSAESPLVHSGTVVGYIRDSIRVRWDRTGFEETVRDTSKFERTQPTLLSRFPVGTRLRLTVRGSGAILEGRVTGECTQDPGAMVMVWWDSFAGPTPFPVAEGGRVGELEVVEAAVANSTPGVA